MMSLFALGTVFYPETVMAMINPNPAVIAVGKTSLQMMGPVYLHRSGNDSGTGALWRGDDTVRDVGGRWTPCGLSCPAELLHGPRVGYGSAGGVVLCCPVHPPLLSLAMAWKFWSGGWQNVEL